MAFTVDWINKIVYSTASITDIPVTRNQLRDLEESDIGMLYPPIIAYKEINLGGGSIFPAIEFVNGYTLQFSAGNYEISGGNLLADINPVAGVFVDRTTSGSYAVTSNASSGPSGLTAEQASQLFDMYRMMKLNVGSVVTYTPFRITVDNDIDIKLTGDGENMSKAERQ